MTNLNGLIWYGIPWIIGLAIMVWMRRIQDKDIEFQKAMSESLDYDDDNLLGDFAKFLVLLVGVILYLIGSIAFSHMLGNSFLPNYFRAWQCTIYTIIIQGAIAYAIWEKKPDSSANKASSD